jgi:hypothetical protein
MKTKILIIVVAILLFTLSVSAFTVKLKNTTNKILIYEIIWLESDWEEGKIQPASMAVGEIDPGKTNTITTNFEAGPYVIEWRSLYSSDDEFYRSYLFKVEKQECIVLSTPKSEPIIE